MNECKTAHNMDAVLISGVYNALCATLLYGIFADYCVSTELCIADMQYSLSQVRQFIN